jgi:hypothetical protein
MEIVKFKSIRLLWLIYLIPIFLLTIKTPYHYYIQDGVIHALRGLLSVGGILGGFCYSLGIRVFSKTFWKVYFLLMLIDETYAFSFQLEWDIFAAITFAIIFPMYLPLYQYSFKNTSLWEPTFNK